MKRIATASLLLACHSLCLAGYYQVYYPFPGYGPVATIVGPNGNPWTSPYAYDAWAGRYGGGGISQDQPNPPFQSMPGTGSVDANGQITVTFVWVKTDGDDDDTPPPYVLIIKDSTASWTGDSGNCANGLGDPEVSGSSSGIHYELYANPPEQFTRLITPVVHAVADDPPIIAECATGNVSIRYVAVPIEIKLTGVLHADKDRRLMIGQNLGAYVSIGGLTMGSNPTYSWNVSGGNPFQSWNIDANADSATVTQFTTQTTPTLSTYLRAYTISGSFSVSCSFYWPWMNTTLNLTEDFKAVKPSAVTEVTIVDPEMARVINQQEFEYVRDEQHPEIVILYDPPTDTVGIMWKGWIDTPANFEGAGHGSWAITQLVTPYRKVDGLVPYGTSYFPAWTVNGRYGLDGAFPYAGWSHSADGSEGIPNDSPQQSINDGTDYHYGHVLDSFDTYYIYKPPGASSQYVPLTSLEWYWKAYVHHTAQASTWTWDSREAMWGSSGDFPPHPTWTYRHDTGNWDWNPE